MMTVSVLFQAQETSVELSAGWHSQKGEHSAPKTKPQVQHILLFKALLSTAQENLHLSYSA